jgi:hypothetical protein
MADENRPMSPVLRIAIQLGTGALIGLVGSSVGGPSVISWWYAPPIKDAFSCASSVKNALQQFVMMQLVCAAAGGVGVAVLYFLFSRARAAKKSATGAVS